MDTKHFPKFYFDSNEYFGYINSIEELNNVYELNIQPGNRYMTMKDFLMECRSSDNSGILNFGLRTEHCGSKTLDNFLRQNLDLRDYISLVITQKVIQDYKWIEGPASTEAMHGFVSGANFVLNFLKK